MSRQFHFDWDAQGDIAATALALFAFLDDHARLVAHMEKPSLMMAGATVKTSTDNGRDQSVGSRIHLQGRWLGIALAVEEAVIEYCPPLRKTWETCVEPQLLVIGQYRMGFELTPQTATTRLRVWIAYDLPSKFPQRWFGWILSGAYARWCVKQMLRDASRAFS